MKRREFLWAVAAGSPLLCSAAETTEQRGKRVIGECLAALGGSKYLAMRDRVETGRAYSFYHEKLSGLSIAKISTRYLTRPEPPQEGFFGEKQRQAFGKKFDDVVLLSESAGYEITFRGARPLADSRVTQYKDSTLLNIFYILRQRLGEPELVFESHGSDFIDNRPVEIVDISDGRNRTVTVFFDQITKLPDRQKFFRRDPINNDKLEEVTIFAKYRDVGGGVMWPYSIRRERNGDKIYEMYSDNVAINQGLKDDLFALPPEMKILKKQD